jgi:hypothetical protein
MRQILSHVLLGMLLLLSCGLFAQETTGVISGTVTDGSGAVVPGATVTITNIDRNAVIRTVVTDQNGAYTAPLLPIGHYGVKIEAASFKTYDKTGVVLNVNDRLQVNAQLQLGGHQELVNVEADALQVQTQDATAAGLISGTQVRELSLKSRNYEELLQLMPGVTADTGDSLYMGVSAPSGGTNEVAFSINGSLGAQNNWSVDGADNVDRGGNFTLLNYPSVDAIAEFKVLRGEYNAEFGRGAGGQINVITRSGTSQFHGGLYEFFRNDALDANTWLNNTQGVAKQPFRYNDFGGTIGGPIFIPGHYNHERNKTFFFFSEEARRVIESFSTQSTVPTALERQGDFSQSCFAFDANGNCTTFGPSSTPVINPAAAAYIKDVYSKIGLPQSGNLLVANEHNTFNYRQEILRIDHTFNQRLSIFGRYMNDNIPTIEDGGLFNGNSIPGIATTHTNSPGRSIVVTATMTFTPTFLNDLSYAYSYGAVLSSNAGNALTYAGSPDIAAIYTAPGALPYPNTLNRIPNISFSNLTGFAGFGDYKDYNHNNSVFDNLTKVWGRHTLKFGAQFHNYQKHENAGGPNTGNFSFSGDTIGLEWQNFLLGNADNYSQASNDFDAKIRQHVFEAYAQDEWRVRPNLTLNYGVRFSRFGSPYDEGGHTTSFDPSKFNPANAPVVDSAGNLCITDPSTQLPVGCDAGQTPNPNYNPLNGVVVGGKNPVTNTPVYFAPRIGIAWDPTGTGRTSIRSGYGVFIDSEAVNIVENNLFTNPPFIEFPSYNSPAFDNPGASKAGSVNNAPLALGGLAKNWKQPYTQQWSFDVQHQFGLGFLVDVGYYGNKGTHLVNYLDLNQPTPGAYATALAGNPNYGGGQLTADNSALLNLIRPYQGYTSINVYEPAFSSNYHSLQASLQKKFKGNSLISANYTWSKALSNLHFPAEYSVPQVTTNVQQDYGPTRYNRGQEFNIDFVYDIPWLASQEGFVGHVLGGWDLSGIIEAESGANLTAGTTSSNDPGGVGLQTNALPDQIANPNHGAPHNATEWFNTAAFQDVPCDPTNGIPCQFRPGNARIGSILGPGMQKWDLSLFKNMKFTERLSMQFRAEAFNIFNHTNYSGVDTTVGSSTYGNITSAHDNRILQLGLKLNF